MNRKKRYLYLFFSIILVLLMLSSCLPDSIGFMEAKEPEIINTVVQKSPSKPTGPLAKVSGDLLEVREMSLSDDIDVQDIQDAVPLVPFENNQPKIEIRLTFLTPEILIQIEDTGMSVSDYHYEYARVYGTIDPALLEQVASIPEVTTIHPNYAPIK